MDNLDVICIGAAIVDIPLQPVSKNIFDVDSYPLERIAMTTGGVFSPGTFSAQSHSTSELLRTL